MLRSAPLPVELRADPCAAPGDVVTALAKLLLDRARRTVAARLAHRPDPHGGPDVCHVVTDDTGFCDEADG